MLGKPVLESPEWVDQAPGTGPIRAWYFAHPPLPAWVSPYLPGTVEVVYLDDKIVRKTLNPQLGG